MTSPVEEARAMERAVEEEAARAAPLRELTDLLALGDVGLRAIGCRIVGVGRDASGDIYLSNGRGITFARLTEALRATSLMEQVVATTGAEPKLRNEDARHVVALMRQVGTVEESMTEDTIATQWGRDFIEEADVLDLNMDDQGERWAAFEHLRNRQPEVGNARDCVVLRHTDGTLYVRTGWFRSYVRRTGDHLLSPGALATRMMRVGWERPGKEGRVKATRPDLPGSEVQTFYVVPPGWDERSESVPAAPPEEAGMGEGSPDGSKPSPTTSELHPLTSPSGADGGG